MLGIAQTGTGKTASFTLPMITILARGRARARMPRSLVLCPTRELAAQVAENFDTYAQHVKLTKALLIGGVSFKEQDMLIDKGVDVLIATPGRLLDHFERGKLILNDVKIMVVDEADRMLDMGFIPDIERIFGLVPFTRQTLFFSATMAPEIERITNTFLSNPARIEVARQATASETIEQRLIEFRPSRRDRETAASEKREMLRAAINAEAERCTNAIIFCNRKVDVDIVAKSLKKHGYDAEPIHGDLDQSHRTRTLDGFREGKLRFLIASDVAARGLDIPSVSHVFNYDLPSHAEDYIHRIGRTGRAGRSGVAISLGVPSDDKYLGAIEALIGGPIPRADAPWAPNAAAATTTPGSTATAEDDSAPRSRSRRSRGGRGAKRDEPAAIAPRVEASPAVAAVEPVEPAQRPARTERSEQTPRGEHSEQTPRGEHSEQTPRGELSERPARFERGERPEREDRADRPARDHRHDRNRDDRNRGRGHDGGDRAMGMGDHLPDFIAKSFDERRGGPPRPFVAEDEDSDTVTDVVETQTQPATIAEDIADAPKPKRRRRVKKAEAVAPAETADAAA